VTAQKYGSENGESRFHIKTGQLWFRNRIPGVDDDAHSIFEDVYAIHRIFSKDGRKRRSMRIHKREHERYRDDTRNVPGLVSTL